MERTPVESLRKGLEILQLLCAAGREGLTLAQVADEMGFKRTTTHNLLKTLSMCGHALNVGEGRYRVGPKIADIARLLTSALPVAPRLTAIVGQLAVELNENVVLTTLVGDRRRVLARAHGTQAVQVDSRAMESPTGYLWQTPTGRVLAACCSPVELDGIISHEGLPCESWDALESRADLVRALGAVREAGFSEHHRREVAALAVPVETAGGDLLGALGMHMPEYRWYQETRIEILGALRQAADLLAGVWSDGLSGLASAGGCEFRALRGWMVDEHLMERS